MANTCIIKSSKNDFCNMCGAYFPPRIGEGICKNWEECLKKQIEETKEQVRGTDIPSSETKEG